MILCDCDWKYPEDQDECPACGKPAPNRPQGVQQYNSTLKQYKRLSSNSQINSRSKKRRSTLGNRQKQAMRAKAKNSPMQCSHCGRKISYWKYSNIDHITPKSQKPVLIVDPENMQVLCDDIDIMRDNNACQGEKSCHSIKHFGAQKEWDAQKGKYL